MGSGYQQKNREKNPKQKAQNNGRNKQVNGSRDPSNKNQGVNRFNLLNSVGTSKGSEDISTNYASGVETSNTPKAWKKNKRPRNDTKKGPEVRGHDKGKQQVTAVTVKSTEKVVKGKGVVVEEHAKKDVCMHEGETSSKDPAHTMDKGHGIKIVMDVEVITLNILRFVESPEPPDLTSPIMEVLVKGQLLETKGLKPRVIVIRWTR